MPGSKLLFQEQQISMLNVVILFNSSNLPVEN
jgi:hypothetical protein